MSATTPLARAPAASAAADRALNAAAAVWLGAALIGQWLFLAYIAAFYGSSIATGNLEAWNRLAAIGATQTYRPGDAVGNTAFAAHALAAGIIAFGGALQLMPAVRRRWPTFHRWNGRVFLTTVVGLSLSGFYLVWVRNKDPGLGSTTINGVLILAFAALALRAALQRDIASHRRWALRLYLVSNAQWFLRVGVFGTFVGARGLGVKLPGDLVFTTWTFACFLLPLAVLELYLRAGDSSRPAARYAAAGVIGALTLLMAVGIVGFSGVSVMLVTGAPLSFS